MELLDGVLLLASYKKSLDVDDVSRDLDSLKRLIIESQTAASKIPQGRKKKRV